MGGETTQLNAEAWLNRHGDALYRYALARTGVRDQAEDLVQETLLAAWRGRDRFRGDASERTWLLGILKHKLLDQRRAYARIRDRLSNDNGEDRLEIHLFRANGAWQEPPGHWGRDPLDELQYDAFIDTLSQCLEHIPATQRESFVLRELGELDADAAGEVLGVTTNNLYVLLHRARLRLRRCLQSHWFKPEDKRS